MFDTRTLNEDISQADKLFSKFIGKIHNVGKSKQHNINGSSSYSEQDT